MRGYLTLILLHIVLVAGCGGTDPQQVLSCDGYVFDICQYHGEWVVAEAQRQEDGNPRNSLAVFSEGVCFPDDLEISARSLRSDGDTLYVVTVGYPVQDAVLAFPSLSHLRSNSPIHTRVLEGPDVGAFGPLQVVMTDAWVIPQWVDWSIDGSTYRDPVWQTANLPELESLLTVFANTDRVCYSLACAAGASPHIVASVYTTGGCDILFIDATREQTLHSNADSCALLCMSPTGGICAALTKTEVMLFDCETLQMLWAREVFFPEYPHPSVYRSRRLDFATDSVLAVATGDRLLLVNCETGEVADQCSLKSPTAVTFSSDGSQLAVGCWSDGYQVRVYDWDASRQCLLSSN